jgi:hypothetical protein
MQQLSTYTSWAFSRNFTGPHQRKILIADLPNFGGGAFTDLSSVITQVSVSYTMDLASELSFDVLDPGLAMSKNNYFTLGRDVIYQTQAIGQVAPASSKINLVSQLFEIANVTVSQGPGGSCSYSVKCYTKAVQQMKRDKTAGTIKGSGAQYVRNAAKKYGLKFAGQEAGSGGAITSTKGSRQSESVWDVIQRIAEAAKFVCYEIDGYLIFASEQWLLHKWGVDKRNVPKLVPDPANPGKRKQKGFKEQRWIPLQFPNYSSDYLGTPGRFLLTEHPNITKSDNDPYAADGSCMVERVNGTQLRPGMTAYVGTVPNMSGFYLITEVSFNEMTPDAVSISFRTPERTEQQKKNLKLLPVGQLYTQTYVAGGLPQIKTTIQEAKLASGRAITKNQIDARILPLPTDSSRYAYPSMIYANMTSVHAMIKNEITGGKPNSNSTNDKDTVIYVGNLDLYNRPALPSSNGLHTTFSITITQQFGSEWRAILLPSIFTQGGVAVMKTEAEIVSAFNAAGGYLGTGKHLGVIRGDTEAKAILNARDYGKLISMQQEQICYKRFPSVNGNLNLVPNTPGGTDSLW